MIYTAISSASNVLNLLGHEGLSVESSRDHKDARRAWVLAALIVAAWMIASVTGRAQQTQSDGPPAVDPGDSSSQTPSPQSPSAELPAPQTAAAPKGDERKGSFLFAPMPISSPAIGTGIVPVVGYLFPISREDKESPVSLIAVGGLATDNGSRGFTLAGQLYFHENTYRAQALYVRGNLNYDLYGIGLIAGNRGDKLPLKQTGQLFFGEFLRRIHWQFFAGPRFIAGTSIITLRPSSDSGVEPPLDVGLHTGVRALGFKIERDTRPNRFYPTTGTQIDFTADFYAQGLGSKYSYQSYNLVFNKYWTVASNQVLAFDSFFCKTTGEPPFYGNCIYGTKNQLRGYTAGRYLDRSMAGMQAEYRIALPKRFGLAGFVGIGEVVPGDDQLFRINNFLPAAGGGVRFNLSTKYHVNLRVDAARGKNSHTISMGVGEAF